MENATRAWNYSQHIKESLKHSANYNNIVNDSDFFLSPTYVPRKLPECISIIQNVLLGIFIVTTVVGFIGNTLTITAIIATKQHTKSVATCFILNLAIADDLFILSLPFQAHSSYTSRWIFGRAMCVILNPFYGINLFASIFTMVLLSMDRYFAIKQPLKSIKYRRPRNAGLVCVAIWIGSLITVTPMWMYADVHHSCGTRMPVNVKYAWSGVQLILGFLVPIVVMLVCYSHLIKHLLRGRQVIQAQAPNHARRVTKMVMLVTSIFVVCWTPWHVLKYLPRSHVVANICAVISMNVVAQTLVFVSSCCNPFIYWISSRNFRSMYWTVVGQCFPTLRRSRSGGRSMYAKTVSTKSYGVKFNCTPQGPTKYLGSPTADAESCALRLLREPPKKRDNAY